MKRVTPEERTTVPGAVDVEARIEEAKQAPQAPQPPAQPETPGEVPAA
jgi:hypothetical protein